MGTSLIRQDWVCPFCQTKNTENIGINRNIICNNCESSFLLEDIIAGEDLSEALVNYADTIVKMVLDRVTRS